VAEAVKGSALSVVNELNSPPKAKEWRAKTETKIRPEQQLEAVYSWRRIIATHRRMVSCTNHPLCRDIATSWECKY